MLTLYKIESLTTDLQSGEVWVPMFPLPILLCAKKYTYIYKK